jgi:Ca2+-transporting ATPase
MVRDPQTQEGGLARLLRGLDDAEAARRLAAFGPNRIQAGRTRGTAAIIAEAMREPTFLLLLAAVVVYLLLGDPGQGAFLLASAVATIGLVVAQEARSERALAALRKIAEPQARVVRDGAARRVAAAELVPGDIVLVMEGERLPADGVLVAGDVLSVDESALTGESVPVAKTPDPAQAGGGEAARPGEANAPWLFSGTLVVRGQGSACVTRTGPTTEIGRIGASLAGLDLEAPPLQRTTRRLVRQMGLFAIAAAAAVTVAYGLIEGDWAGGALAALTLGISMVPEEFPMVLAIFLALGAWRMAQHKVLVRRGAAIETLGAMSLLCVDKTGTLTENRMEVAVLWRDGRSWEIAAAPPPEAPARVLHVAALASAPEPVDPMDRAVRSLVGTQADGGRRPIRSWPLRPDRLAFVQAWEELDGDVLLAAKGAPEAVVAQFAMRGLRVLAVASARRTADGHLEPEQVRFSFEGLVGFADPVRADVPPALASARHAGIAVAMITGRPLECAIAVGVLLTGLPFYVLFGRR